MGKMFAMVEVAVRELDSQGRVSIPKKWRRDWKSRRMTLIRHNDRIELVPTQPVLPSELFDSIEISGDVDFTDPHSLKKAFSELRER
jgi:bifunctional DNA-binding transcriptional regulator/antitoxin component of YhaV-PrlF toxin-antitoxin module